MSERWTLIKTMFTKGYVSPQCFYGSHDRCTAETCHCPHHHR